MKSRLMLAALAVGAILVTPGIAAAANAFTTGNVNMRAGPSTQYPRVTTIPYGASVEVYGCTSGWRWCDTSWRGIRGWVSASYLELLYRDRRVYVPEYAPRVGVPVITFQFGSYWDRWYRDRPWYHDRQRWARDWDDRDRWRRDRDWGDRDRRRDRDWDDRREWRSGRDDRGDGPRDRGRDRGFERGSADVRVCPPWIAKDGGC